jgi:hypothetical protein
VVSPTNPYFARAGVNRRWSYFLGTGLTDPVDEQGDHNPPSHPVWGLGVGIGDIANIFFWL